MTAESKLALAEARVAILLTTLRAASGCATIRGARLIMRDALDALAAEPPAILAVCQRAAQALEMDSSTQEYIPAKQEALERLSLFRSTNQTA